VASPSVLAQQPASPLPSFLVGYPVAFPGSVAHQQQRQGLDEDQRQQQHEFHERLHEQFHRHFEQQRKWHLQHMQFQAPNQQQPGEQEPEKPGDPVDAVQPSPAKRLKPSEQAAGPRVREGIEGSLLLQSGARVELAKGSRMLLHKADGGRIEVVVDSSGMICEARRLSLMAGDLGIVEPDNGSAPSSLISKAKSRRAR